MSKFRKKPVVIEAFVWSPHKPATEGPDWFYSACEARNVYPQFDGTLAVQTLEGVMVAQPGDYVIRGVQGELYPCKPDIFAATYDPVDSVETLTDERRMELDGRAQSAWESRL